MQLIGIILDISYICNLITSKHMKCSETNQSPGVYLTPSMRIVDLELDVSFLESNLEPIGGGDDPEIDW